MTGPPTVRVHVSGDLALFTRPEAKVERASYSVITPSAARGVVEAILWKPQMHWIISRIIVLKPIRYATFKRNEVGRKIPGRDAASWARKNAGGNDYFADDDRQQRNALLLRDIAYIVEAQVELTDKAGPSDNAGKYIGMTTRRLEKGQCFSTPYLGCREFAADVRTPEKTDVPAPEIAEARNVPLGRMLLDVEYADDGRRLAHFFDAIMDRGVIEVPRLVPSLKGGAA